jgi:hypothetical protein
VFLQEAINHFLVIFGCVIKPVDVGTFSSGGKVWGICIDKRSLINSEPTQILRSVSADNVAGYGGERFPICNYSRVYINTNLSLCWELMTHHSPPTEMGLDVGSMRRHQIYEVRVTFSFSAWISHRQIIANIGDDVKRGSSPLESVRVHRCFHREPDRGEQPDVLIRRNLWSPNRAPKD